jgi:hypothetical protein
MNADKVKLRVFHRTKNDISLLWSMENLNPDQRTNVKVLCEGKTLKFTITEADDKDDVARNTMICLIDHEVNGLKHDAKYTLQVFLGGDQGEPIVRKIVVLEYGVLPPFDRDKKSSRVHLMGWETSSSTWVKLPVVRTADGSYAIPMVMVPADKK